MGFGLICAGYSTLLFMRLIPVEFIGFLFVLKGLIRLSYLNKYFGYAKKSVYPILVFSFADIVYWITSYFLKLTDSHILESIFTYAHRIVFIPFYIFLFLAIRKISEELGYTKGIKRATLALSVTAVYYIVFAASSLNITGIAHYLTAADIVMYLVLFLAAESAVYLCYRAITTDEAEQKEEEELRKFEERFGRKKNKESKNAASKGSKKK